MTTVSTIKLGFQPADLPQRGWVGSFRTRTQPAACANVVYWGWGLAPTSTISLRHGQCAVCGVPVVSARV
jgi:hypothetical protein